jgi:chromate transporter
MALFVFAIPFPIVVLSAAVIAFLVEKFRDNPSQLSAPAVEVDALGTAQHTGTMRAAIICLVLWLATILTLHLWLGSGNTFTQIADFFSRMAVVSFGGAYAVLSYVAQQAVEQYQWLAPGEMLDGLGLAETTPGPLILVTQFVGFLGAWRHAGVEPSLLLASMGALLTTWVTFLPCFLWIFAGAPYVEKLRQHKALAEALAGITAVVVGVIANLALWFALNFLFADTLQINNAYIDMQLPVVSSINIPNLALSAVAFVLLFALRLNMLAMLGTCALLGMIWTLL